MLLKPTGLRLPSGLQGHASSSHGYAGTYSFGVSPNADANTLYELNCGRAYWFLIDQDVTLDVYGVSINLICTGDDCWNLIV